MSSVIRARYCNQEFPGCRTLNTFRRHPVRGYLIDGICKVCGRKSSFHTITIRQAKSCGCLNGKANHYATEEDLIKKHTGEIHGNLEFAGGITRKDQHHLALVRCTKCGATREVKLSSWVRRTSTRCDCDHSDAMARKVDFLYAKARWDIEHIWPAVVKAGREAMEAHHG